jgi:hypothetical protein
MGNASDRWPTEGNNKAVRSYLSEGSSNTGDRGAEYIPPLECIPFCSLIRSSHGSHWLPRQVVHQGSPYRQGRLWV